MPTFNGWNLRIGAGWWVMTVKQNWPLNELGMNTSTGSSHLCDFALMQLENLFRQ